MSRALDGAWRKGRQAALDGLPVTACPYQDKRKPSGKLSWSRAFMNAWEDGWRNHAPRPDRIPQTPCPYCGSTTATPDPYRGGYDACDGCGVI